MSTVTAPRSVLSVGRYVVADGPCRKEELHASLVQELDRSRTKALSVPPTDVAKKGERVNTENTFGRRTDLYAHGGKFYARRMSMELDETTREPTGAVKIQWFELSASGVTKTAFPEAPRSVLLVDRFVVR